MPVLDFSVCKMLLKMGEFNGMKMFCHLSVEALRSYLSME